MVEPTGATRAPYQFDDVVDGVVAPFKVTPQTSSTMKSAEQEPSRGFFQKFYDAIKWLFQKIFCCFGSSKKAEDSTAFVKQRDEVDGARPTPKKQTDAVDEVYTASEEQRDEVKRMLDQFTKDPNYSADCVLVDDNYIDIGSVLESGHTVVEFFGKALMLHAAEKNLTASQYRQLEQEVDDLLQFALKHHTPKKYGQNISLQQHKTYIQFGCYSGSNSVSHQDEKKQEFLKLNLPNLRGLFGLELKFTDVDRTPVMKFQLTGGGVFQTVHSVIGKTG